MTIPIYFITEMIMSLSTENAVGSMQLTYQIFLTELSHDGSIAHDSWMPAHREAEMIQPFHREAEMFGSKQKNVAFRAVCINLSKVV